MPVSGSGELGNASRKQSVQWIMKIWGGRQIRVKRRGGKRREVMAGSYIPNPCAS